MTQATVLAWVDAISGDRADGTPLAQRAATTSLYAEVATLLAREGWIANVALLPTTAGTAVYFPSSETVEVLGAFFDDRALARGRVDELRWTATQWRDVRGEPLVWIQDQETTDSFRLMPTPDVGSAAFTYDAGTGTHLGVGFPPNALGVFFAESRIDLPAWLDLPVALLVLAREFSRESDHRDPAFAGTCEQLGRILLAMVR